MWLKLEVFSEASSFLSLTLSTQSQGGMKRVEQGVQARLKDTGPAIWETSSITWEARPTY